MHILRTIIALASVAALASCSTEYKIEGSSNIPTLDGQKLYLKVVNDDELKSKDSCDVVHGQFTLTGTIDSVKMGTIFMDNTYLLPVVLEGGDITIKIDNAQGVISGTPLNDKLYKFLKQFNQLQNQQDELVHKHDQAIMNGEDMNIVNQQLAAEDSRISSRMDHLLTSFVSDNFDNALGPGVFMIATMGYPYPMLTPWIDDILSKATDRFKSDPYVREYMAAAKRNQDIMNGMEEPQAPAYDAPGTTADAPIAPMTPQQMAGDSAK